MECQVKSLLRAKNNPYSFSGKGVVLCTSNQCLLDSTIFLNYDYIRKLKSDSVKAKPWELLVPDENTETRLIEDIAVALRGDRGLEQSGNRTKVIDCVTYSGRSSGRSRIGT
jgi:hypothetical protein